MAEMLLTSSALILLLTALRALLRDRLSPRLRYGLWLLVALRLLIPGSLFSFPLSLPALAEKTGLTQGAEGIILTHEEPLSPQPDDPAPVFPGAAANAGQPSEEGLTAPSAGGEAALSGHPTGSYVPPEEETGGGRSQWLKWVWYGGMALMGLWFLVTNLRFRLRLKKHSLPLEGDFPLPVRTCPGIPSPCLSGLLRPTVYIPPCCVGEEGQMGHILAHEYTHFRQGDQFWALVRCACLVVWWFNPLVWLAALLSRRDCELSCDAGALRRLGEEERIPYGRTLVDMVAAAQSPAALLHTATTMTGGKKSITERVSLIVRRPRMTALTLLSVLLIVTLAAACTFGGAAHGEPLPRERYGTYYTGEILSHPEDGSLYSSTHFTAEITDDFFCHSYSTGTARRFTSVLSPEYEQTDMTPAIAALLEGDDKATLYTVSPDHPSLRLLVVGDTLCLVFNGDTDSPVLHRLTDERPEEPPADDPPAPADPVPDDKEEEAVSEAELTALVLGPEMAMRNDNSFTFDDPTQLSTEELYLLFLLRTDYEVLETCWDEAAERFVFSDAFIREQLSRYLRDFRFDITQHQNYDSGADAIVTPLASGFGGDRYTDMTGLTRSGSVVTFRLAFYDHYEMTGDPYQIKEYALEFYDGGFYYLYAREVVPTETPTAEAIDLAQSVYSAIVGSHDSRDFFVEVTDHTAAGGSTTRIHMTEDNCWNLPESIGKYPPPNPTGAGRFEWAYAEPCECDTTLTLTLISADGKTKLTCYDGCNAVTLEIDGARCLLNVRVPDGHDSDYTLFRVLLGMAGDALIYGEARSIVIDPDTLSISPAEDENGRRAAEYRAVVEEYARQYAANLNALPAWVPDRPEQTVYHTSGVSGAYFGEGTENFLSGFGLYLSPELSTATDWQAGSGMERETEGEYAGWWAWGTGAHFVRNEDGNWVCTGTYTGGEHLLFPTPLEEASLEELVYYFHHTLATPGDHKYNIPYAICTKPLSALDELNALLTDHGSARENCLCHLLGAFLRDYGSYGDLTLTYEVLSAGLDEAHLPCLEEGYHSLTHE